MKQNRLTVTEIQLVQRTFEMLIPLADTFALIFYERFFALEPEVRPLFKSEMWSQRERLITMMAFIIRRLDQPEVFAEELKKLGLRHVAYGVQPAHYPVMSEAVIWALKECLGEKATDEMCAAWQKMLLLVSDSMLASVPA